MRVVTSQRECACTKRGRRSNGGGVSGEGTKGGGMRTFPCPGGAGSQRVRSRVVFSCEWGVGQRGRGGRGEPLCALLARKRGRRALGVGAARSIRASCWLSREWG